MTERHFDAAVIGSGIAGTACAYELAKRGLSVAVLDRSFAGGHQSRRALGFVEMMERNPFKARLSAAAAECWRSLVAEFEGELEWKATGELVLATSPEEYRDLQGWVAMAKVNGIAARIIDVDEIAELVHGYAAPPHGGVFIERSAHVEPTKLMDAYLTAARRRGVTFLEGCPVQAVVVARGRVTGVRTRTGEIVAPLVICAAGASTTRALRSVGVRLPTMVVRGMVLETGTTAPVAEVAVMVGGLAFRQRPTGSIYASDITQGIHSLSLDTVRFARDFLPTIDKSVLSLLRADRALVEDLCRLVRGRRTAAGIDVDPRWLSEPRPVRGVNRDALAQLRRIASTTAGATLGREWAGSIEFTIDQLPVAGPVGEPEGLIAIALSGHGITLAPLVARLLAAEVVDGERSEDLWRLRPSRFTENDFVAAGLAHGWSAPAAMDGPR